MTTARRNPREKKDLAYRKDHVVASEYPHAFRQNWPRKKARSHRIYRRRVNQLLDQVCEVPTGEDDERGDVRAEAVRREIVRKYGVVTLRDRVAHTREGRIRSTAWNFFKTPYNPVEHQTRFAAFLASVMASETPYLREVASFFGGLLDGGEVGYSGRPLPPSPQHRAWMRAFLADDPSWEPRLRGWIAWARGEAGGGGRATDAG